MRPSDVVASELKDGDAKGNNPPIKDIIELNDITVYIAQHGPQLRSALDVTVDIVEAKNPAEVLIVLDKISSQTTPIPNYLFELLEVDELTDQEVCQMLEELHPRPPKNSEQKNERISAANRLFCPFSYQFMRNPVKASDGKTYDAVNLQFALRTTNRDVSERGFMDIGMTSDRVTPDLTTRTEIIDVLRLVARKKINADQKSNLSSSTMLCSTPAALRDIIWTENAREFKNYPNPFVRLALTQLRRPELGINLIDVRAMDGRLILETREGTFQTQERLTKALQYIFPSEENDAATLRIPSEVTDRFLGVKINWETNSIEGVGGQQENWINILLRELSDTVQEITPVMTKAYAAELILRFIDHIENPAKIFRKDAKPLEAFPTLEQQSNLNITPEADYIITVLLGKRFATTPNFPNMDLYREKISTIRKIIGVVESETAYDQHGNPFVRIQIYQPEFHLALERFKRKIPDLKDAITRAQALRYRTAMSEEFINEATAFATGTKRALTELEFKGVSNKEAFFTVKTQLPKAYKGIKHFVFRCDCSGSMSHWDDEQQSLLEDLYTKSVKTPERKKFSALTFQELFKLLEDERGRGDLSFSKKYKDLLEAFYNNEITNRIFYAKKAFRAVYKKIRKIPNARFSLMEYGESNGGNFVKDLKDVSIDHPDILTAINSLHAYEWGTYVKPSVKKMLELRKPNVDLIEISLTDGLATEILLAINENNKQPVEGLIEQLILEFAKDVSIPTIIHIGYKSNEFQAFTKDGPLPEEEQKKYRQYAEKAVIQYACLGGPGSEAYTIKKSHRLAEAISNVTSNFLKGAPEIVYLEVDCKEIENKIELVAYPNQLTTRTIRIPWNGAPEIYFPGFGKYTIYSEVKASDDTIKSAHIDEAETELLKNNINPRVYITLATQRAKNIISEMKEAALKISEETKDIGTHIAKNAVIEYLDKVMNRRFTALQAHKTAEIVSVEKDKVAIHEAMEMIKKGNALEARNEAGLIGSLSSLLQTAPVAAANQQTPNVAAPASAAAPASLESSIPKKTLRF